MKKLQKCAVGNAAWPTIFLLLPLFVLTACIRQAVQPEPKLLVAPLSNLAGRWHVVDAATLRLTVNAPGAEQVRFLYQPFAAIGQHAELQRLTARRGQSEFVYEWPAGPDLMGDVWAEVRYAGNTQKKTDPLALAHASALSEQLGEAPLDSVGGSIDGDESARADQFTRGRIERTTLKPGDHRIWITVNVPAFQLTLWQNGREVKTYEIGIGRKKFPLPVGARRASEIVWNPAWIPPDSSWVAEAEDVEPGEEIEADDPRNPLGKIKIRLGDAILIHEAAKPSDIGGLVSHGCVRMRTDDLYELTELIVAARALPITREQIAATRTNTERLTVKLDPPVWVDINYDTEVIEGRILHLYPDVYNRTKDALTTLRRELEEAGIAATRLDEQTLKQMRERVQRTEKFVVSLDDMQQGRALTTGRNEPLIRQRNAPTTSAR